MFNSSLLLVLLCAFIIISNMFHPRDYCPSRLDYYFFWMDLAVVAVSLIPPIDWLLIFSFAVVAFSQYSFLNLFPRKTPNKNSSKK